MLRKVGQATLKGVRATVGPTGIPNSAYRFYGKSNSYVQFPKVDTKSSTTLIAWVKPEKPGPIFNYQINGWGVHLWVTNRRQLFVRFVKRNGGFTHPVIANVLRPNRWNYIAATYSRNSGRASLWKNGHRVGTRLIGRIVLKTQYPARMGARIGDGRYFRGCISCMQVYGRVLTGREQKSVKYRCTPGKISSC